MNKILFLLLFIFTACESMHNVSLSNQTEDTLIVKTYPPLSEWTYTLNCINGYIAFEIDTINGDSSIKYSPSGKFMEYKIFPNSYFVLESDEGSPLSEDNLQLDKVQIKNQQGKKILNLRSKKHIIRSCFQQEEGSLNETEYLIEIN